MLWGWGENRIKGIKNTGSRVRWPHHKGPVLPKACRRQRVKQITATGRRSIPHVGNSHFQGPEVAASGQSEGPREASVAKWSEGAVAGEAREVGAGGRHGWVIQGLGGHCQDLAFSAWKEHQCKFFYASDANTCLTGHWYSKN